ncbi:MAG TPA: hypothetical protein VKE98_21820, partial [Gemmataceae bacterium]|nr:hypothetical protein [Gemmataceae bacterium]
VLAGSPGSLQNSTMSNLRLLDRITKEYRKCLRDPDYFECKQLRAISEESKRPGVMDFKREVPLLTSMGIYSTWRGMVGSVKIADGDPSGWGDIRMAFLYRAWDVRTKIASGDRAGKIRDFSLNYGIAGTHGLAIVLGDQAYANWIGERVLRSFKTKERAFTNDLDAPPFAPFLFQLHSLWQGEKFDLSRYRGCGLGPYADIVKHWHSTDADAFRNALQTACDARADNSPLGETCIVPTTQVPVEILAVFIVRKSLGLPTPPFSHPLLETPFAQVPAVVDTPTDPILTAAINKIREAHPEIGEPW